MSDVSASGDARKPYLLKQRRIEILASLAELFPDLKPITAAAVLELFPEFNNTFRVTSFLNSAAAKGELDRIARGQFAVPLALSESPTRRPRLLKARRIEIMSSLYERFPPPETFTYDDMLRLFPETGPRNNVYSIIAAAMGRGELERVDAGSFRFATRRILDPARMPSLPPKTIEHTHLVRSVEKAYFKSPYYQRSDVLIPLKHFRAAIYGSDFDPTTADRLCPRCHVIDEIQPGNSEKDPPPFDILICYVDANDQAHVKIAGSWQFELLSKPSVEPTAP